MPDYIPRPDGEFDAWQANFVTYASPIDGFGACRGVDWGVR